MTSKREYRKAYRKWRREGVRMSSALLAIWRLLIPDSEYSTYHRPEAVVEAVRDRLDGVLHTESTQRAPRSASRR